MSWICCNTIFIQYIRFSSPWKSGVWFLGKVFSMVNAFIFQEWILWSASSLFCYDQCGHSLWRCMIFWRFSPLHATWFLYWSDSEVQLQFSIITFIFVSIFNCLMSSKNTPLQRSAQLSLPWFPTGWSTVWWVRHTCWRPFINHDKPLQSLEMILVFIYSKSVL